LAAALVGLAVTHLSAVSAEPPAATDLPTGLLIDTAGAGPNFIGIEAEAGLVGQTVMVGEDAAASGGSFVSFSGPAPPAAGAGVRVAGNRLLRDGVPFVPVGFSMVARVNPTGEGQTAVAARRLDDGTMEAAIGWGANTLRFQVSQRGLDPTDSLYSDAYVNQIVDAVALARAHGLVVLLSIQDQGPSGGSGHAQPSDATIRDWQTLIARFNGDLDVLYEMFNEPHNRATPDGWSVWRDGGPAGRNQGLPAVGHQAVLDAIRATGAQNVVVAEAGQYGQLLDGIPLVHDPLGQVAYGVHPYLTHSLRDPADWEPGFGFLASQYPVVATEWAANSRLSFCHPEWETTAPQLIDFLEAHDIGILAWAFDVVGSVILDWRHTPTSLDGFQCGPFQHGVGSLLKARMPAWGPHLSGCETGLSDTGVVALPIDVPQDGTYQLWSRVMPPGAGIVAKVPPLQVDDGCPVPAWAGAAPEGTWSWQSAPGTGLSLTAGRHTVRFFGAPGGVNLDRVLLVADPATTPTSFS
jgi:hypothetical protein